MSPFARSLTYHASRFHLKQELGWLAYRAGKTLVLPWGRRSGKSDLFSEIMIEDVEDSGYDSLFVAITQKQARKIIWKKLFKRLQHEPGWKFNETRLEAVFKGGPSIAVKGADLRADDLAGGAYRIIACDEYALWKKPQVKDEILAPMLGDYNGQFLFGSTKRGKNHFYRLHQAAKRDPQKYFITEATIFDNPFISAEGRAKVLSEYEGGETNPLYRQEILNEYVVFQGMAFALEQETYIDRRWDPATLDFAVHWRGVDHGYSPDPTAAVWIAYNGRKGYFQVYGEYKQNELLISTHAHVIRNAEPYSIHDTYSDVDPQVIAEYEAVGLPMTPAAKADKFARILRVVNAMRTGRLKIAANCTQLLEELQSYEWDQDGNDHLIDALIMGFTNLTMPEPALPHEEEEPTRREYLPTNYQSFGD